MPLNERTALDAVPSIVPASICTRAANGRGSGGFAQPAATRFAATIAVAPRRKRIAGVLMCGPGVGVQAMLVPWRRAERWLRDSLATCAQPITGRGATIKQGQRSKVRGQK